MPPLTSRKCHPIPRPVGVLTLLALLWCACPSHAQSEEYNLSASRTWDRVEAVAPSADELTIAKARRALAEDKPSKAHKVLTVWLDANADAPSPLVPEAYLLRGDALVAMDNEFKSLFDYEAVIKGYPQSDAFRVAVERELEIGLAYANGKKSKWLGMRIGDSTDAAVEILIRVQERMPGSALAERASMALGDYYFERRDMALAREAYDLYLINHPMGAERAKATSRRIYAEVARFKGPRYDAAGLLNARVRIEDFAARYPVQAEQSGLNESMASRIDESLAAQYLDTASWYLKVKDKSSAKFALRRLIREYPQTLAAQHALNIMQQHGWITPPLLLTPASPSDSSAPADKGVEHEGGASDENIAEGSE
jgi:tetratricopeptide (TPR) repeat protein